MTKQLQEEFKFYLKNQNELVKQYNGKYLVIKGQDIFGAFSSFDEAYVTASKELDAGTFLIQRCSHGSDDYTLNFYSNVAFG